MGKAAHLQRRPSFGWVFLWGFEMEWTYILGGAITGGFILWLITLPVLYFLCISLAVSLKEWIKVVTEGDIPDFPRSKTKHFSRFIDFLKKKMPKASDDRVAAIFICILLWALIVSLVWFSLDSDMDFIKESWQYFILLWAVKACYYIGHVIGPLAIFLTIFEVITQLAKWAYQLNKKIKEHIHNESIHKK